MQAFAINKKTFTFLFKEEVLFSFYISCKILHFTHSSQLIVKNVTKTADYWQFYYIGIISGGNIKFQRVNIFYNVITEMSYWVPNYYFYCCFEQNLLIQFSFWI